MKWKLKEEYKKAFFPRNTPEKVIKEFCEGKRGLGAFFRWAYTPEGYGFWEGKYRMYLNGRDIRGEVLRITCEGYILEDCTWV